LTIPILRPEAVTPDWLTAVLAQGGVEARVAGFTAKPVGTGQIGQSVKFTLDYARAGTNAPASLVGKFPAPGEESRGTGVALGNYIREANFYNHLAPTALIATLASEKLRSANSASGTSGSPRFRFCHTTNSASTTPRAVIEA